MENVLHLQCLEPVQNDRQVPIEVTGTKEFIVLYGKLTKGWSKLVQHFIQHHVFAMLDEMLEWFAQLQNL